MNCAWPPSGAATASPPPRKGRAVAASSSSPAATNIRRMPRSSTVAGHEVGKLNWPRWQRIVAISSPRSRQGASARTPMTKGFSSSMPGKVKPSQAKGVRGSMAGRMAEEATRASSSVVPSGLARATSCVPIAPESPARSSTTMLNGRPARRGAYCASVRAAISAAPGRERHDQRHRPFRLRRGRRGQGCGEPSAAMRNHQRNLPLSPHHGPLPGPAGRGRVDMHLHAMLPRVS